MKLHREWTLTGVLLISSLAVARADICGNAPGTSPVCDFLRAQYTQGLAAGNIGDWYDDADSGHSRVAMIPNHPQVQPMTSSQGPRLYYEPGRVMLGNSSMAYGDARTKTRSFPRDFLATPLDKIDKLDEQYRHNTFYWYPAVTDVESGEDRLAGMLPMHGTTFGHSFSDKLKVEKSLYALAAFRPDVKKKLIETGLLMPTMVMAFRRGSVASDSEYMSGKANPSAFADTDSALGIAQVANAITLDKIPPMVQIRAEQDTYDAVKDRDFFDVNQLNQRVIDSPNAITRLARGLEKTKHIIVNAQASFDINHRPLTYHWAVIRGAPGAVRITPLNADSSRVDIAFDYHNRTPDPFTGWKNNLAVVGAFVNNGAFFSAPAFISEETSATENRTYDATTGLLQRIDYIATYVDPDYSTVKQWLSDTFHYDSQGKMTGWTRKDTSSSSSEWTPEGYLVVSKDAQNHPLQVQRVEYVYAVTGTNYKIGWAKAGTPFDYGNGAVASPVFSLPAGNYETAQQVALTCAIPGAVIRYAVNTPFTEDSPVYTGPISIGPYSVIRAQAFKAGMAPSVSVMNVYTMTPPTTLALESTYMPVAETQPFATFTVVKSGVQTPGTTISINYKTMDNTALAGRDYTATEGTLTFSPSETRKTIQIPILNNASQDGNRVAMLWLTNAVNTTGSGIATILINDDDAGSADLHVQVTATPNPVTINQSITYTVEVTNPGTVTAKAPSFDTQWPSTSMTASSLSTTQGTCKSTSYILCTLGDIAPGVKITIKALLRAANPGPIDIFSETYSSTFDPNQEDNKVTTTLQIQDADVPQITSAGALAVVTGDPFSYQIEATNAPTSYAAAPLPAGSTLNGHTGLISGTATSTGTYAVTLKAYNAYGFGSKILTLTVSAPGNTPLVPSITSAATALGTVGQSFSYQIAASQSPTSYAVTGLPSGLSVNSQTGAISGTPQSAGTFIVHLAATNATGTGMKDLSLTVRPATPVITSAASDTTQVGVAYSYATTAANNPVSYAATGLPTGLTVNTVSGVISGTPQTPGTAVIHLSATNSGGTGTKDLTLTIRPAVPQITSPDTDSGQVGLAYDYEITATNLPDTFGATGLPQGLSINTHSGMITGMPQIAGSFTVHLSATNTGGTATKDLAVTIIPADSLIPIITSAASKQGAVGQTLSYAIKATHVPTSYSALNLPSGLTLDTHSGVISGIPQAAGTFTVRLGATNTSGSGTKDVIFTILPVRPTITNSGAVQGRIGQSLSYAIVATNAPTSFAATGLPSGLVLDPQTGMISGTPGVEGIFVLHLSATNLGGTGTKDISLTIRPAAPVITSPDHAQAVIDQAFQYRVTAANNATSFQATGLPQGLSINSQTGLISGTPQKAGDFIVQLKASNATGDGFLLLTLTVRTVAPIDPPEITGFIGLEAKMPLNAHLFVQANHFVRLEWTFQPRGAPSAALSRSPARSAAGTVVYSASHADLSLSSLSLSAGLYGIDVVAVGEDEVRSASLHAEVEFTSVSTSQPQVYPNPWRADRNREVGIVFEALPLDSTVKIYTVSGQHVRTMAAPEGHVIWDRKNGAGDLIGSGIYLYVVTDESGQKKRGKLAVIR